MLTSLRVRNFKRLDDVEIELGKTVVFVGLNNSGKTTALQALALWEIGLRRWLEKSEKRPGVTINRRDLVAVPVPDANLLWRDLRAAGVAIEILVSGVTAGRVWDCGFAFDHANEESFYCRPLPSENAEPMPATLRIAFLPPMSGLAAVEDRLDAGSVDVRIGEGRTAEVLRNLCNRVSSAEDPNSWMALEGSDPKTFWSTPEPPAVHSGTRTDHDVVPGEERN